jgi:hypothetical protein
MRTVGPLPGLIEALAPLGMPEVRCDSRRSHSGWVTRTCAVMYVACSWARPIVINVAVVVVIHVLAIRCVFLVIGTT